ncbi:5'-3'-deoxyribonucleotidase [Pantoea sp. BIGb0393]|uniref:5'-3'-deoxyribonucleotidase n=1 Tax=Pantoea nemavictus TaxID=2726955 RepID=A0ABU8PYM6_9GAMM|nr:5'-3'-deoxyribonucleotidase [Pantoea nemavictus]MBA0038863.1 5'-3'-deoxyribonucleotidase [Pantoea nemavictus]
MKRIAIDMDEVIADFNGKMIPSFNARFNAHITLADLEGLTIQQLRPDIKEQVEEMIGEAKFFGDLAVMPDSQRVIKILARKYEIFITTAAMEFPLSFDAKFRWLEYHFPFINPMNIVFCGSKSILNADYLIDDNARHFEKFNGEAILFSAPHNKHVTGFHRVKNWLEIESFFYASK